MEVGADPVTEAVRACVRELVGTVEGQVTVDRFVETRLKGVSEDSLSRLRVEQLKEMHRRLNEGLNDPVPMPTMRFAYARNEKALLVDSLVQTRTRLSQLAGPSEEDEEGAEPTPKRGKADGAGHWFVPASIQQRNLDSLAGPKHAAIMALSNSQAEYLNNLNLFQHGTGKEANRFKADVKLAVTGFFSRVPEDRPAEVEAAIRSSLLDAGKYEANKKAYGKAVAVLQTQLERVKNNAEAPLMKVPESAMALFKRVETSLVDRPAMLDRVLEKVQTNLDKIKRPSKDKRSGCVLEITRLARNKKRAAFLDPDHEHHKTTRMAVHLAIVGEGMDDVRTELLEASTIDGRALAARRDAYHDAQHPDHAKVHKLVEAEVARRRAERGIPAPEPRNAVGEIIVDKKSAAYKKAPTQADLQPQHDACAKAREEIGLRYPMFGHYATEARREEAARKRQQQARAAQKAEAARKAGEQATLARHRECSKYVLFMADLAKKRAEATARAKVLDETTSEWL